jgi:serine/threonine-protein kinase
MDLERVGPYRVVSTLHSGPHGSVLLADGEHGAKVAIKTVEPRFAKKHQMSERFLRGARAAASAKSPHLVKVLDVGMLIDTGHLWCAMEFIEGETLATRLERRAAGSRALDAAVAARLVRQVGLALQAMHRVGVVHRNVKPGNAMLTPHKGFDAHVTLVGMGLVKPAERERGEEMTSRGTVIGTPAYLAPEALVDSSMVDETADIYSLGVFLYELLAGQLPFTGPTVVAQITAKQNPMPPIATKPELTRILARMLAADRKRRPRKVDEVLAVLEDASEEETRRDRPAVAQAKVIVAPDEPPAATLKDPPQRRRPITLPTIPKARVEPRTAEHPRTDPQHTPPVHEPDFAEPDATEIDPSPFGRRWK